MKIKNKITGQIIDLTKQGNGVGTYNNWTLGYCYKSIAELCREWTDYEEEPEKYWFIEDGDGVCSDIDSNWEDDEYRKQIGNYFGTKEEAELAVKKLQAIRQLKDKGFKFKGWSIPKKGPARVIIEANGAPDIAKELDLLFRGEEK